MDLNPEAYMLMERFADDLYASINSLIPWEMDMEKKYRVELWQNPVGIIRHMNYLITRVRCIFANAKDRWQKEIRSRLFAPYYYNYILHLV